MIRQKQFQQSFPGLQHFLGIRDHLHARLDRPDTGRGEHARSCIHDAQATNTNGSLVLQMAQRGNRDPVHARGIEDTGARGHAHRLPVNRYVNDANWCGDRAHNLVSLA